MPRPIPVTPKKRPRIPVTVQDVVGNVLGAKGPAKGATRDLTPVLGPPPPGTYDPVLDYNAGAASRGYGQAVNDADTLYEQGQQDYGLGLGDLTRGRDYSLADLLTGENRLNQDYGFQTSELGRNYGILGRQQAEGAAQRGVTSAGLLGKQAQVRAGNQTREQGQIDLAHNRGLEDIGTGRTRTNTAFDQGKLRLDLGNVRQFGGYQGNGLTNPLTGKPEAGALLTGVQRAFTENDAYQQGILGQKVRQAQAGGYVSPLLNPTPLTPAQIRSRARLVQKANS